MSDGLPTPVTVGVPTPVSELKKQAPVYTAAGCQVFRDARPLRTEPDEASAQAMADKLNKAAKKPCC